MKKKVYYIIVAAVMCFVATGFHNPTIGSGSNSSIDITAQLRLIKEAADNCKLLQYLEKQGRPDLLDSMNDILFKHVVRDINDTTALRAFAISSSKLANMYMDKDELSKADSVLNYWINRNASLIEYDKNIVGGTVNMANVPAVVLYTQGWLYYDLGAYDMARALLVDAKNRFVLDNDTTSVDYLKCLFSLCQLYFSLGEPFLSQAYCDEACRILDNTDNKLKDNTYLKDLRYFSQGIVDYIFGREEGAKDNFKKVIDINEKDNLDDKEENLSVIKIFMLTLGDYNPEKARMMLDSEQDPSMRNTLQSLILSKTDICDSATLKIFKDYRSELIDYINNIASHFSTFEIENFWNDESLKLVWLGNNMADSIPEIRGLAYDDILFTKSFMMNRRKCIKNLAKENKLNGYRKLGMDLCKMNDVTGSSIKRLELADFEKRILKSYQQEWQEGVSNCASSWDKVTNILDTNEVAIEFSFIRDTVRTNQSKVCFCAYVLKGGIEAPEQIKLIRLGQIQEISTYFELLTSFNDDRKKAFINLLYNDPDMFYDKLWKPIEDSGVLDGVNAIYYSPCGDINKINLGALMTDDGKTRLANKYVFHEVLSTAFIEKVKDKNQQNLHPEKAYVYSNINYDTSPDSMRMAVHGNSSTWTSAHAKDETHTMAMQNDNRVSGVSGFGSLTKGGLEAKSVEEPLTKHGTKVELIDGQKATEESFKRISDCGLMSYIIHIISHGFSFYNKTEKQMSSALAGKKGSTKKNDEMLNNGIVFSGANHAWLGNPVEGVEDGILTAEEVSWMDLNDCKLVVLSACETGLGTADLVDGVFGLQRGFKIAEVDKIIMSLWSVNDEATAYLMEEFYRLLTEGGDNHNGLSCHEALECAKEKFRREKIKVEEHWMDFSDPYYWAGFVLLE